MKPFKVLFFLYKLFCKLFYKKPNLKLFLQCSVLVAVVFPDVIFQGASISMLDQLNITDKERPIHTFYEERYFLQPSQGFGDYIGGAAQSEPAIQFLKHSIYNLQSPYWNPFSGAGSLGPETLVDIKFSPLTFLVAILGGSSLIFHIVSLFIYTLALYFLARTLEDGLGFSRRTALIAGIVYILNGYFTANISSNTNQAYLYFPFAIFAVITFSKRPNQNNYFRLVVAYVLPLSVTFFPTTVLMVTSVVTVAAAACLRREYDWKRRIQILLLQSSAPLCAFGLLAFLYFPLIETLSTLGTLEAYNLRTFTAANYKALIGLFTAKHVFESYNAMNPLFSDFARNSIYHFGILAGCVSSLAIFCRNWFKDPILTAFNLLLLISLFRIFNFPFVSGLIEYLPFYRNVGEQYWWMMVACAFPFVFAYGFTFIERKQSFTWPAFLLCALILLDLSYILHTFGIVNPPSPSLYINGEQARVYLIKLSLILTVGLTTIVLTRKNRYGSILASLLCCFIAFEMIFYFNTARYLREDIVKDPPDYIQFLQKNLGLNRVANYGSKGLPPDIGSAFQLQQIDFFAMNILPTYYSYCQKNLTSEHAWWGKDTFCANRDTHNDPNINLTSLNMLSVKYTLVSKFMNKFVNFFDSNHFRRAFENKNFIIFENPTVYPRVYAVDTIFQSSLTPETKNQNPKAVAFSEDKQLLQEATFQGVTTTATVNADQNLNLFFQQKIISYKNTEIQIEANFDKSGILILPDNWHSNWKATVDGKPAYVGRVNEIMRGIVIGTGRHQVTMTYRPASLTLGFFVSSLCFLILLFIFLRRRHFRFRPDN